jgi:hypothetical protein
MKRKISRTVIAAIKNRQGRVFMGADRQSSYDWGQAELMERPKIRKENGILVGASGDGGLCTLLVDVMEFPIMEGKDTDLYMFYTFKPRLLNMLLAHGYRDEHKLLRIPGDLSCGLLVAVKGKLYKVDIQNMDQTSPHSHGEISIDSAPFPNAIGCGDIPAIVSLKKDAKQLGYSTKEHLIEAIQLACEISPGCGIIPNNKVDIIGED